MIERMSWTGKAVCVILLRNLGIVITYSYMWELSFFTDVRFTLPDQRWNQY